MTNIQKAKEQGNQSAPNVIDAAKVSEVQIDVTLAQEQGNQAAPLIADSLANSELYDAIKQQGNQAMPLIVDALVQPTPSTESPMYLEAAQPNSTVSMVSTLETAPNLEYSIDGVTWQEWEYTDQTLEGTTVHIFDIITLGAVGDKVYLRGNNPNGLVDYENENITIMLLSGVFNCGGSLTSLLDNDGITMTSLPAGALMSLMRGNGPGDAGGATLLSLPTLGNVTTIGDGALYGMFTYRIDITKPIDMSKITSVGMEGLSATYKDCTSLTAAAAMPALTTIGDFGCKDMYYDCTFDMSDDGTTLNFAFPTPPVTAGNNTYNTAYDIAEMMGNTNGFRGAEQ